MKLLNCLVLGLLLSLAPLPSWAGAYDQLVGMAGGSGNVPSVPDPSPSEYQGYNNTSYSNESSNSYDYAAAEERRRVRQVERQRKAKQREEARKNRERKRRDDREDREDREWQKKQDLRQVTLKQLPPSWQLKSKPGARSGAGKTIAAGNMSDLSSMQKQIAELRKQPGKDSQVAELEAKVLQLWGKVVSSSSGSERVRRMLRLPVGIAADSGTPVPHLSQAMLVQMLQAQTARDQQIIDDLQEGLVPVKTGLVNFARDYLQEVVSGAPASIVEAATEGELSSLVENLPVVARITMAFRESDMASGMATAADYVVGRVQFPQSSIAEAGRKIYVNVALESLNNFMDKASGAVGMTHDRKVFWQELKQQATVGQRAFMEWLGVKSE